MRASGHNKRTCPDCSDYGREEQRPRTESVATPQDVPVTIPWSYPTEDAKDGPDALFVALYMSGRYPYYRREFERDVKHDSPLHPGGECKLLRKVFDKAFRQELYISDEWAALVAWDKRGNKAEVEVIATAEDLTEVVTIRTQAQFTKIEKTKDDSVTVMNFWYRGPHGPTKHNRKIDAMTWESMAGNYPSCVAELNRLARMGADDIHGRMILLYGPPGTGKTTFLRALATEWREWCDADYVLDPEQLFGNAAYLTQMVAGDSSTEYDDEGYEVEAKDRKWRMLIMEDTGELIAADAKKEQGQALSRLLNLADGILGQGSRVIIVVTTNEELRKLHSAVTRPGRLLSQVEFRPMPYDTAAAWAMARDMDTSILERREYTLAELIGIQNGTIPGKTARTRVGFGL